MFDVDDEDRAIRNYVVTDDMAAFDVAALTEQVAEQVFSSGMRILTKDFPGILDIAEKGLGSGGTARRQIFGFLPERPPGLLR